MYTRKEAELMKRKYIEYDGESLVEVFKYEGQQSIKSAPEWVKKAFSSMKLFFDAFGNLILRTALGLRNIMIGDYIVKEEDSDSMSCCRSDLFSKLYECV